jgi:PAT family beta-lactamase induction signal transducer AmpG
MALGMMIPGMISGWLQELIGYQHFFIWVMICTIPSFVVIPFLKIDPAFGKKNSE